MSGDKLCHRWVTDQVTSLRNACWLKFSDSYKTTCFTRISITSGATNSRVISKTLSMYRMLWATTKVNFDSRIPISQTLCFLKFLIIQTKPTFPSPVKHSNFSHVFSNLLMIQTNLLFPRWFEKSEFHYSKIRVALQWCEATSKWKPFGKAIISCFIIPVNWEIITSSKLNMGFLSVPNLVPWLIFNVIINN